MRALFLSIVAFVVMTGLPAAAHAAAAPGDCPPGHVCLYKGKGGTGTRVCAEDASTGVRCLNVRSAYNNGVSDPGKNDARLYDLGGAFITCVKRGQVKNLPGPDGYANVFRVTWGTC
ncbi:peptidase inhibitor family I36 protein [Nonomuraea sp. NPDC050394]|uniref:peptidase inhibitor family I36 protein n=1 Tax=Nonomuraea sp. NPDC050394 TaxID=3364363 RepID=UPI0037ACE675